MTGLTTFLLLPGRAEEAARFWEAAIPGTRVGAVRRAPADYPGGSAGDALTVEFAIGGHPFVALNAGPDAAPSQAVSFQLHPADQAETDRLWDALLAGGGAPSRCGWLTDRFGVSWQVTPRALTEGMADPDPAAARRVMEAMLTMAKIDVAAIERARSGSGPGSGPEAGAAS